MIMLELMIGQDLWEIIRRAAEWSNFGRFDISLKKCLVGRDHFWWSRYIYLRL